MLNSKKTQEEKPFKVFYSEEEWNEAIEDEISRRETEATGDNSVENIKNRLLAEAQKIKERVPDFDFLKMLREDKDFRERILKGYTVEEAFYLSNRKKQEEPTPKKRIGMRENGRNNFRGTGASRNVSNMSDEEFKKYINSLKGSKI